MKQTYEFIKWQRDEIGKLIKEVSEIRIPAITETNEDIIKNAYHLIIADFEWAKPLLYKQNDPVTMKVFSIPLVDVIIKCKILNWILKKI